MLPMMVRLILALTVFFFVVSLVQLTYLHWTIQNAPELDLSGALEKFEEHPPQTFNERMRLAELQMLAGLDAGSTEQRYHQVNAALMARVWTRYMGFVTGMVLALVGAVFILGKMRETVTVSTNSDRAGATTIRSASPGLILCLLGVVMMLTTIIVNHRIDIVDAPGNMRYFNSDVTLDGELTLPFPAEDDTEDDESD